MREPAKQHTLPQRTLGSGLGILRQEPQPHRYLATGDRGDVAAVDAHETCGRRAQARQRAQQQGFSGAIATQQRDEFAGADGAVERVDENPAGDCDAQLRGFEHGAHSRIQRISSAVESPTTTSVERLRHLEGARVDRVTAGHDFRE